MTVTGIDRVPDDPGGVVRPKVARRSHHCRPASPRLRPAESVVRGHSVVTEW